MKAKSTHRIYGIIGTELKHSLSPMIYGYMHQQASVNGTYSIFEIEKASLGALVNSLRLLDIKGVSITYPFKESICKYLDHLDKSADDIKAVNLVKNVNGKLTGYNADKFGIRKTISDKIGVNIRNNNIVLIGSGGAARACLSELLKFSPANIVILNRTMKNSKKMIKAVSGKIKKTNIISTEINRFFDLKSPLKYNLIVNATSASPKILSTTP